MKKFLLCISWSLQVFAYQSQCGQDRFVHENYFFFLKNGIFVDIGAHDGVSLSNTYFFEKEMGWTGICVEPMPEIFKLLKANRDAVCVQGCISDQVGSKRFLQISGPVEMLSGLMDKYDPRHLERIDRELLRDGGYSEIIDVKCYLLNDLLEEQGIDHVNFLSIDTEGGEFEILSSIDFSRVQVDVITVENNYHDPRFIPLMSEKGFRFVQSLEQDMIFLNNSFSFDERR